MDDQEENDNGPPKSPTGSNGGESQELSGDEEEQKSTNARKLGDKGDHPERTNYLVSCIFGILILFISYFVLYLIIGYYSSNQSADEAETTIKSRLSPEGLETCGADSFMLRDAICDEATNTEICLFDGGECCREGKVRDQCKDCSCRALIDLEKLQGQFEELNIKPLSLTENPFDSGVALKRVTIEDVVSHETCAVVCLEHELKMQINAWQYNEDVKECQCLWMKSKSCPETKAVTDWNPMTKALEKMSLHQSYIQLEKNIPCECMALDFQITSQRTDRSKADALKKESHMASAWECQQDCLADFDCHWFSWWHNNTQETHGDCWLLKEMDGDQNLMTDIIYSPGWLSSGKTCDAYHENLTSYWDNTMETTRFVCPTMEGEVMKEKADLLVLLWVTIDSQQQDNNVNVLRVGNDTMTECVHNILLPVALEDATGGIILDQHGDQQVIVCGGRDLTTGQENLQCFNLHDRSTSDLGLPRNGAATLTADYGKSLWVTGGSSDGDDLLLSSTEYVSHQSQSRLVGPLLPTIHGLKHHCLVKVNAETALMIGGENHEGGHDAMTWFYRMSSRTEDEIVMEGPSLNQARSMHVCGVLRDKTLPDDSTKRIVVVAGGKTTDQHHDWLGTVETLEIANYLEADSPQSFEQSLWTMTDELPLLGNPSGATTSDQLQLFVIGHDGTTSTTIVYVIECSYLKCSSRTLEDISVMLSGLSVNKNLGLALLLGSQPASTYNFQGSMMVQETNMPNDDNDSDNDNVPDAPSKKVDDWTMVFATGSNADLFTYEYGPEVMAVAGETGEVSRCKSDRFFNDELDDSLVEHYRCLMEEATGGIVKFDYTATQKYYRYTPVVCDDDACYMLGEFPGDQGAQGSLVAYFWNTPRIGAASVSINNYATLWVTGGSYEVTTEFLDVNPGLYLDQTMGPNLPIPIKGHCLDIIKDDKAGTKVILYGGKSSPGVFRKDAWTIDLVDGDASGGWTPIPSMSLTRERHSCGVIQALTSKEEAEEEAVVIVVAAGGCSFDVKGMVTDSVELLHVLHIRNGTQTVVDSANDNQWVSGPSMPEALCGATSATLPDRSRMYVAGGAGWVNNQGQIVPSSKSIHYIECQQLTPMTSAVSCQWSTLSDIELFRTRVSGVGLVLPLIKARDASITGPKSCEGETCHLSGNGICNGDHNVEECLYDGGDCCLKPPDFCMDCDWPGGGCVCHQSGQSYCEIPSNTDNPSC